VASHFSVADDGDNAPTNRFITGTPLLKQGSQTSLGVWDRRAASPPRTRGIIGTDGYRSTISCLMAVTCIMPELAFDVCERKWEWMGHVLGLRLDSRSICRPI
jgi:hypothetical protein